MFGAFPSIAGKAPILRGRFLTAAKTGRDVLHGGKTDGPVLAHCVDGVPLHSTRAVLLTGKNRGRYSFFFFIFVSMASNNGCLNFIHFFFTVFSRDGRIALVVRTLRVRIIPLSSGIISRNPYRFLGLADQKEFSKVIIFSGSIILFMGLLSFPFSFMRRFSASMRVAFALSLMFYNSGNYGLPVIELVFGKNSMTSSIQIMVLTTQNIVNFTLGIFLIAKGKHTFRESARRTLRFPMLYAVVIAFVLRGFHVPVWKPLWVSIDSIGDALIPVALIMLGAQLARIRFTSGLLDPILSSFCRLFIGPLIALALIALFRFDAATAKTLIISSSMPSAVNTALLATEFDNEPQFATQAVFISTLLSIVTVSVTIYCAAILYH